MDKLESLTEDEEEEDAVEGASAAVPEPVIVKQTVKSLTQEVEEEIERINLLSIPPPSAATELATENLPAQVKEH